jgi:putative membrane protein
MIVDRKRSWLKLVLTWKGSVLKKIWRRLLVTVTISALTTFGWTYTHPNPSPVLTVIPFTLIGLALSIFLGFRNNTSYDRFWEGRRLWGGFVNTSRTFARQTLTLIHARDPDDQPHVAALQRRMVYAAIAYIHLVRMQLRQKVDLDALEDLLSEQQRQALVHAPSPSVRVLLWLAQDAQEATARGWLDPLHATTLEASLTSLTDLQGGCERIRSTPIPFSYTVLIHRIVAIYCLGLPFGILDQVKHFTPLVVAMVSYAFYGLDAIGDEIEDPFGEDDNDLPLHAISRNIEINLRDALGEDPLPPQLLPVHGVLK